MRRLLLALFLAGCACGTSQVDLASRWSPLTAIRRDASVPAGLYRTRGPVVATREPCEFLARSQVDQEGLLLHEQLHSQRQGVGQDQAWWFAMFATSRAFRWQEESLGWERQLRYVSAHGGSVDRSYVATALSTSYDGMVSYEDAVAWVDSVLR